jgi:hypothetical protein
VASCWLAEVVEEQRKWGGWSDGWLWRRAGRGQRLLVSPDPLPLRTQETANIRRGILVISHLSWLALEMQIFWDGGSRQI